MQDLLWYQSSGSKPVVRVPLVLREGLHGGTRIGLHSAFLHKNIHPQLSVAQLEV